MKISGLYPDVPWADVEAIWKARFDKQTLDIHYVAYALRPDCCGSDSKISPSVFDTVRRYIRGQLVDADADRAIREFTHFRMKSGGPPGQGAQLTLGEAPEPLFGPSSMVYDDSFKPAFAWRCLLIQGSTLARVAVRVLDALANSVPSERSFSSVGNVHDDKRNRLGTEKADQQTFCYVNSRVLECLHDPSLQRKKRWYHLEEKDWVDLEETYITLFSAAQDHHQYMHNDLVNNPEYQWHGVLQSTGDLLALGTEVSEEENQEEESEANLSRKEAKKLSKKRKRRAN